MDKRRDKVKTGLIVATTAPPTTPKPNPDPLAMTTAPAAAREPDPVPAAAAKTKGRSNVIRPTSVGLRSDEIADLDTIAGSVGVARNALMSWAIRQFLADYHAGRVKLSEHLTTETRRVLIVRKPGRV